MSGKPVSDKKRYVQIGRVAIVNFGQHTNKLVVILNILDASRVLVEGPTSGVRRQVLTTHRLALTPIAIAIPRNARQGTLNKIYAESKVDEKWSQTSWAKKIATRAHRAQMTDLDRFKVVIARRKLNKVARVEYNKLKKALPARPKRATPKAKPAQTKKAPAAAKPKVQKKKVQKKKVTKGAPKAIKAAAKSSGKK